MRCYKCKSPLNQDSWYGLHTSCFISWFCLTKETEFTRLSRKANAGESGNKSVFHQMNSSFFHGKYKKYSAELGQYSYILKVQEEDCRELPATEYLSNELARSFGLNIPDFFIIDLYGSPTFLTRNFINKERGENLVHIYRYLRGVQYNCEEICKVIKKETNRLYEVERFVELCLFDGLIGNHDRHGRNLGIIESKDTKCLSPFYDNPSYIGIESDSFLVADLSPRGKIATSKTTEPLLLDYIEEFVRLGFGDIVVNFSKKAEDLNLISIIETSFISELRKRAFQNLIEKNKRDLKNGF